MIDNFPPPPTKITRREWLLLAVSLAAVAVCTWSGDAKAADMELRGRVDTYMADKVRANCTPGHCDFTINTSNGGFIFAARNIVDVIKANGGSVTANGFCYSSCALIVAALGNRQAAGADVQFHASYNPQTGKETTDAADWLAALGLPRELAQGPNLRPMGRASNPPPPRCADVFHC